MYPNFDLFGREIWLYQIMTIFGIFSIGAYIYITCKKLKYNEVDAIILLLLCFLGVLIGGHILYALTNFEIIVIAVKNIQLINSFSRFMELMGEIFGGNVFYGGLLGGLLTAFIIVRKKPHYRPFIDIAVTGIPLFHFWGRIGCFFSGCCYGIESEFGFTMHRSPVEQANDINRFPVQLLEAVFNLCLFIFLHFLFKKGKFKDKLLYIYLLCYSAGRFFIEFLRGDEHRGFFFGMSTSQNISIVLLIFSLIMFFRSPSKIKNKVQHDR